VERARAFALTPPLVDAIRDECMRNPGRADTQVRPYLAFYLLDVLERVARMQVTRHFSN
jgi:hypothetical protein